MNRKQSLRLPAIGDPSGLLFDVAALNGSPNLAGEPPQTPLVAAGPGLGLLELTGTAANKVAWFDKTAIRHFMRLCSIASLVSVCANTSKTFSHHPRLMLLTFAVDLVCGLAFGVEMMLKIYARRLWRGPKAYALDRWCQFEALMVLFIWISLLLQVFEMLHIVEAYSVLSVLRAPRPLILVRFIRVFFSSSMPKSRIKQIFKRSSQQIYNVSCLAGLKFELKPASC